MRSRFVGLTSCQLQNFSRLTPWYLWYSSSGGSISNESNLQSRSRMSNVSRSQLMYLKHRETVAVIRHGILLLLRMGMWCYMRHELWHICVTLNGRMNTLAAVFSTRWSRFVVEFGRPYRMSLHNPGELLHMPEWGSWVQMLSGIFWYGKCSLT